MKKLKILLTILCLTSCVLCLKAQTTPTLKQVAKSGNTAYKGLFYNASYVSSATDRWITDKNYVDSTTQRSISFKANPPLFRWLDKGTTFSTYTVTGANPKGIAFDGTNMWVTNESENSVTKISPVGIAVTYTVTGATPRGIAFDGTNMWTANSGDNSVTKILSNSNR